MTKCILIAGLLAMAACGGTEQQATGPGLGHYFVRAVLPAFEAQSEAPACDAGILKRTGEMVLNADGTGAVTLCRRCAPTVLYTYNPDGTRTPTDPGPLTCDLVGAVSYSSPDSDAHVDLTITPQAGPVVTFRLARSGDWLESRWTELPNGGVADYLSSFRCPNDNCDALVAEIQ